MKLWNMMKKRRKNKKPANGRAKRRYVLYGVLGWLVFSYALLFVYLPDEIYLTKAEQQEGQPLAFADGLPIGIDYEEDVQPVFGAQRTLAASENDGVLTCRLFDLIPLKQVVVHYTDRANVVAAGTNIGIYLKNSGVLVVECASFTDQSGALIAPAAYRIRSGDVIVKVDDTAVHTKEELMDFVAASGGRRMVLHVLRAGKPIDVAVMPEVAADGTSKLGIWVRDDIAGIGTMTYVTEDGEYGALGHGVSDVDTGELIQIDDGSVYETTITGISKGRRGSPGEVTGLIRFQPSCYLGSVEENTENGIYGTIEQLPQTLEDVAQLPVAYKQEITQGPAQIICSVTGERLAYDIEIERIDYHTSEENKGIRYRVTDERLLARTGGIVQGMSGSPIIQNGRLIGAVTHVFVDDPTRGYGIFAESMLEEHTTIY